MTKLPDKIILMGFDEPTEKALAERIVRETTVKPPPTQDSPETTEEGRPA